MPPLARHAPPNLDRPSSPRRDPHPLSPSERSHPSPSFPHFSQSPARHPRPRPPRLARLPPRDDGPLGCLDASRGAFRGDRRGHTPREILPAARSPVLLRRLALARRARVRPRAPGRPAGRRRAPVLPWREPRARRRGRRLGFERRRRRALAPRSRTLGTQSDYRESEAQTVPYEPDFVLPERPSTRQAALNAEHHVDGDAPEVLTLRHLRFGDGNPAGDAEATLVQRMRAKRAFEASLPPLSDVARLPLRQRLMEEWEEAEWAEREREIARVQEERLDVLKRAIDAREAEAEALAETRLKRMRAGMLADKHEKFASIQTKRVKHLRKLAARRDRERVPPEGTRAASAADAHANYASTVYAPLSREEARRGTDHRRTRRTREGSNPASERRSTNSPRSRRPSRETRSTPTPVVDAAKRRDETKKCRATTRGGRRSAPRRHREKSRRGATRRGRGTRRGFVLARADGSARRRRGDDARNDARRRRARIRVPREKSRGASRDARTRAAHGRRGERVSVRGCGDVTASPSRRRRASRDARGRVAASRVDCGDSRRRRDAVGGFRRW